MNLCGAGGADWMSFGFEASTGGDREGPVERSGPALNVLASLSGSAESEVLIADNLRDGEAVMELGDVDFLWLHIGHLVSVLSRGLRCLDRREALSLV